MTAAGITVKYLIIHVDDVGIHEGANEAAVRLLEAGAATSCSVIVPGAAAGEFLKYAAAHGNLDVGVHAAVTCEWDTGRWRPLRETGPLGEEDGGMLRGTEEQTDSIPVRVFSSEVRAQIEKALEYGLKMTHLDNHMWTVRSSGKMLAEYLHTAREASLIPYIPGWIGYSGELRDAIEGSGMLQADGDLSIPDGPGWGYGQRKKELLRTLEDVGEGIRVLTVHAQRKDFMGRKMVRDYKAREEEYELLLDVDVREKIHMEGIRLITWREAARISGNPKRQLSAETNIAGIKQGERKKQWN